MSSYHQKNPPKKQKQKPKKHIELNIYMSSSFSLCVESRKTSYVVFKLGVSIGPNMLKFSSVVLFDMRTAFEILEKK